MVTTTSISQMTSEPFTTGDVHSTTEDVTTQAGVDVTTSPTLTTEMANDVTTSHAVTSQIPTEPTTGVQLTTSTQGAETTTIKQETTTAKPQQITANSLNDYTSYAQSTESNVVVTTEQTVIPPQETTATTATTTSEHLTTVKDYATTTETVQETTEDNTQTTTSSTIVIPTIRTPPPTSTSPSTTTSVTSSQPIQSTSSVSTEQQTTDDGFSTLLPSSTSLLPDVQTTEGTTPSGGGNSNTLGIALGVTFGAVGLIVLVIVIVVIYKRRKPGRRRRTSIDEGPDYNYKDSKQANKKSRANTQLKPKNLDQQQSALYFQPTNSGWDTGDNNENNPKAFDNHGYATPSQNLINGTPKSSFISDNNNDNYYSTVDEGHAGKNGNSDGNTNNEPVKKRSPNPGSLIPAENRYSVGLLDMGTDDFSATNTYDKLYNPTSSFGQHAAYTPLSIKPDSEMNDFGDNEADNDKAAYVDIISEDNNKPEPVHYEDTTVTSAYENSNVNKNIPTVETDDGVYQNETPQREMAETGSFLPDCKALPGSQRTTEL